ncbi:electron transfer flavoprotein subunit beta/FixA family protein [Sphingobacterium sp. SGG-5]|uniref:electron transfer flavoprotein subunit beta/FixA family protein n=1 Tax=Sphingobacterium sp. SGG-5 TaxID=2710881 RepID=UPI0013EBEE25|nr:electron transfer flavoprotein subunit beta/FixA family protein [Sphingobacterium sp. SGG-5]NGM62902.1 electron transfer flavoprotein subunit beta/FixA family protein [Sphingobacterium sp. SGG-5]
MKIIVCISHVPDTTSKITFTDNNTIFNTAGIQFIINPYDEIALSKAIDLASAHAGTVTVITVGDASTDPTIRKALAIGADNAVRVNAEPTEAWFVANQIAHYAKANDFDLILTGRESIDYNGAQVPAMLGELLHIPSVSIAKGISIVDHQAYVEREIEGGKEVISVSLPLVVGTAEGVAEPKIANMRGIMSARTKPLEVIEPTAVEALTKIETFDTLSPQGNVRLINENAVEELVNLLHTEAKVI